jgi:hypothetical protein
MQRTAELIETEVGIGIDVYGFDTGAGLPRPRDYRDQPNMWFEGQLPMNIERVRNKLRRATLNVGLVSETVPAYLERSPAPVAFISFDLDLYSSTRDSLAILNAEHERILPRIVCYFDDIIGHSYSDFTGERLAIREFNDSNEARKLCPIYGLRYFVPRTYGQNFYWDLFYLAHTFDHPLYGELDSLTKAVYTDEDGKDYRLSPKSNWKRDIDPLAP